jgi:hypothetical protein
VLGIAWNGTKVLLTKFTATASIALMKALSSAVAALALILAGFAAAPAVRADVPPDQLKAAGAIPLTTDLLDKMDKFVKAMTTDAAAKAELNEIGKDPSINPDNWASVINSKCPKTVAVFKANSLTPDDFSKAIFAIMAIAFMPDEFAKSADKTVKANADFVAGNKDRADTIFGGFLALSVPAEPASTP